MTDTIHSILPECSSSDTRPSGGVQPHAEAPRDRVLPSLISVSESTGLDAMAKDLTGIHAWLGEDLQELENDLKTVAGQPDDLAEKSAAHLLHLSGKRIRPLCVMAAARVGGRPFDPTVRNLAVAAELVHTATLLHDDVLDEGSRRRGEPAARMIFGNSASILGGDFLLTEALFRVVSTGMRGTLKDLLETVRVMVNAEALQLERRGSFEADRKTYDRVVYGKTASLFAWAMRAGGRAAELNDEEVGALSQVGFGLGMAFQLVDDLLDLSEDGSMTGKDPLADIRDGKLTWPLIIACERDPELFRTLRHIAASPDLLNDASIGEAIRVRTVTTGALPVTRDRARLFANEAIRQLDSLPNGDATVCLAGLIGHAVARLV